MGDELPAGRAAVAARSRSGPVRIGELGRRVGVRPETLRAWERRYELFDPDRTPGNYRLYSAEDEAKARSMATLIASGVSAAEAATLARDAPKIAERAGKGATVAGSAGEVPASDTPRAPARADAGPSPASARTPVLAEAARELTTALAAFDEAEANAILDASFARFSLDDVLASLVLPVLAEVGERWAAGQISVAQEHFCSELLRGRLLAIARGWGAGDGPLALLACPPAEQHDIGLVSFGLALRSRGWRIAFFGARTPIATLGDAAEQLQPQAVVIAAIEPRALEAARGPLRELAERYPLMIGGRAASAAHAAAIGAAHLGGDPIDAANLLATATTA